MNNDQPAIVISEAAVRLVLVAFAVFLALYALSHAFPGVAA